MSRRVSIVCSNNGKNCLGRALLLADLLRSTHDVQVVGPRTTPRDWEPGSTFEVPVLSYPVTSALDDWSASRWLRRNLEGSQVIVCKPKPTSLGLALLAGLRPSHAILDVDDWDVGFGDAPVSSYDFLRRSPHYLKSLLHPKRFNSYLGVRGAFALARAFRVRLVSNRWLQRRVGGHLLPHVRDANFLDPAKLDSETAKAQRGLSGRTWIGFIGTVRAHKGIEDLVDAVATFAGVDAPGLLLAGLSDDDIRSSSKLLDVARQRLGAGRLKIVGRFPFSELPGWLSAVDIVCIPSRPGRTSEGQIPAKIFDALAMGKPTVVSDAHDTSDIDPDAVMRFKAGDIAELSRCLGRLCIDSETRSRLSSRARQVALHRFDYSAGRRVLEPLVASLPAF